MTPVSLQDYALRPSRSLDQPGGGQVARSEDLDLTLTALLVHESTTIGMLGDAFAAYGRIFKTLHLPQFIGSEAYRRILGVRLTIGGGHHARRFKS